MKILIMLALFLSISKTQASEDQDFYSGPSSIVEIGGADLADVSFVFPTSTIVFFKPIKEVSKVASNLLGTQVPIDSLDNFQLDQDQIDDLARRNILAPLIFEIVSDEERIAWSGLNSFLNDSSSKLTLKITSVYQPLRGVYSSIQHENDTNGPSQFSCAFGFRQIFDVEVVNFTPEQKELTPLVGKTLAFKYASIVLLDKDLSSQITIGNGDFSKDPINSNKKLADFKQACDDAGKD